MDVAVQVCVIYTGVRGHLDAITPEQVTDFEEKFVDHITTSQQGNYNNFLKHSWRNIKHFLKILFLDLLNGIKAAGQLTPELEETLKGVIADFLAGYLA